MPNDTAVANPPAGGPQAFASTNDDNANAVLAERPFVVVTSAHGQVGVVDRFATEAEANARRDALRASDRPGYVSFDVVKENDPDNGLPAKLAEVEGAEAGDTTPPAEAAAEDEASKPKGDDGQPKSEAPRAAKSNK